MGIKLGTIYLIIVLVYFLIILLISLLSSRVGDKDIERVSWAVIFSPFLIPLLILFPPALFILWLMKKFGYFDEKDNKINKEPEK